MWNCGRRRIWMRILTDWFCPAGRARCRENCCPNSICLNRCGRKSGRGFRCSQPARDWFCWRRRSAMMTMSISGPCRCAYSAMPTEGSLAVFKPCRNLRVSAGCLWLLSVRHILRQYLRGLPMCAIWTADVRSKMRSLLSAGRIEQR